MPQATINGFKLSYEEVGSGEPFIYIAGTRFDNGKMWVPHFEKHAAGFRGILPDPRGMGDSQHVSSIQPQDWTADLLGLLDHLGIEKVHLAGETLGTRIITRFAADHPERVKTLIINAVILYSAPSGDQQRAGDLSPERRASLIKLHGEDGEAVNKFYLETHAKPEFHEYYDLRVAGPRVQAPTLIVRGDIDDPVHGVDHSVELHKLVPNSWLAIYPNTEFNAFRARPEEVWKTVREFTAANG